MGESPGNTQINGDLMVARRKLRSDGPAPPQPKAYAPPSRPRDPRDESSCIIEEICEEEEEDKSNGTSGVPPAAGYTRVQIEEDSDSEEEPQQSSLDKVSFHKVQIEEASDSEEGEPEREPAANPGQGDCGKAPIATGFHKVQIQEASDSEEEDEALENAAGFHRVQIVDGTDSEEEDQEIASKVCEAAETIAFEDMD